MAVINNVAYSWSMITLASTALGIDEGSTTLEGVSGIKWNKTRKIESNYGLGGKPVSRGFGYPASPEKHIRLADGYWGVRPDCFICQPDGIGRLDYNYRDA